MSGGLGIHVQIPTQDYESPRVAVMMRPLRLTRTHTGTHTNTCTDRDRL